MPTVRRECSPRSIKRLYGKTANRSFHCVPLTERGERSWRTVGTFENRGIPIPFGNAEWITTLPNTSERMQSGAGSLGPHWTAVVSWNETPESWNDPIGPPAFPRGGRRGRAPVPADSSRNVEPRSKTTFRKRFRPRFGSIVF